MADSAQACAPPRCWFARPPGMLRQPTKHYTNIWMKSSPRAALKSTIARLTGRSARRIFLPVCSGRRNPSIAQEERVSMAVENWSESVLLGELGDDPQYSDDLTAIIEQCTSNANLDVLLNFSNVTYLNS